MALFMRFLLSIWLCKILILIGKLSGKKGSSTPGKFALKFCPDVLRILSEKVEKQTICVLGTNGKTTTNNMINMLINQQNHSTVCNTVGANMLDGVVTAYIHSANLFGFLNKEYAVIEIDEASAKIVFAHITPDFIVITNLFRDQLDRYGEIDITIEHLKTAINMVPQAKLILNADDPLCNYFSTFKTNPYITYGISENVLSDKVETKEGRFCQICGNELSYNFYHYSQLGDYECENCGFKRNPPNFSATKVDLENKLAFTLNINLNEEKNGLDDNGDYKDIAPDDIRINLSTYGFYNIYNVLAAISVLDCLNIKIEDYSKNFSFYKPQIARMEEFRFKIPVILNLSKNPAGFNQAIETIANDTRKKAVVIAINDNAQDGYDVSWLYDVDFEHLTAIDYYAVSGKRRYDMALRLFYAEVCTNPLFGKEAIEYTMDFLEKDIEVIYVLVNYTVIFDIQKKLLREERKFKRRSK